MNSTKLYPIATLPSTPTRQDGKPLLLNYAPAAKAGNFTYGDRTLHLTYTLKKTIVSNTHPDGETRQEPPVTTDYVPCSLWVAYFGNWQIEPDQYFTSHGITDVRTETERVSRFCSGFKFDAAKALWTCRWKREDIGEVFNSTFFSSQECELEINLIDCIGYYTEHEYADTAS